jgi:hydroxymethylpyrimidine/phosphomethylpyrimidine kinase
MKINYPIVVSIAGTDPTGGAGIQADIKAISATGAYAASVITALLAQNTQGVQAIQAVTPAFVTQQLDSVFSDLTISAVKIGMLHDQDIIEVVALGLEKYKPALVVLDPVMVAKNGSPLLNLSVIDFLKTRLFPLVTLITPNLFEAEKILNQPIKTKEQMQAAAITLGNEFKLNVLIKGGHLEGVDACDVLYVAQDSSCHWFEEARIDTQHTHGTGCSLSAAIASYLAQGYILVNAIKSAKNYLTKAIASGSRFQIGKGRGPVDHFYYLKEQKIL